MKSQRANFKLITISFILTILLLKTLENFFWPFFAPIYRGFTKLTRTYGGCKWLF